MRKYRWLTEGQHYIYSAAKGKGRDDLRGQECRIVTVPIPGSKPANVLVEFASGERHIVPNGVLRGNRSTRPF